MNKCIKQGIQVGMCMLVLTVAACSQEDAKSLTGDSAVSAEPSQRLNGNSTYTSADGKTMDQQITGAMKDLADRIGVAAEVITVKEARSVQWGSGAMGCPKPGMNYTQALVPGIRLLLEANGTIYYYHGETGKSLFYCPAERAKAPAYGQGTEVM